MNARRLRLVLASASPRRRELLARFPLLDLVVVPSDVIEVDDGDPERHVLRNAQAKADAVARRETGLILGADTAVVHGGTVMGKPGSRTEAAAMLRLLSGTTHDVLTAVHVVDTATSTERSAVVRTAVTFRDLDDQVIERYLDLEEYVGVAGSYAIQGAAAIFALRIEGDYYNVMGLPLCRLDLLLREFGASLLVGGP